MEPGRTVRRLGEATEFRRASVAHSLAALTALPASNVGGAPASGIPAAERSRVFERHYRSGAQAGAGLGLAITRRILELHGASIELESPGVGSVFRFTLPAARA